MKKLLIFIISFLILLIQINLTLAQDNTKDTKVFVEKVFRESISISKSKSLNDKQKENQLSDLINESVDTNWIAKFVIGKYWRQITKQQQRDFIDLYQSYLIKTYIPKFKNYGGGDIKVNKIIQQRENIFFVQAEFDDNEGQIVNIDFRVVKKNNELFITDIIAEGVSFIVTQRSEVGSSISNKGFEEFMKQLEELQK